MSTWLALGCQAGATTTPEGSTEAIAGFSGEPAVVAQVASAETVAALLDGETFEQVEARMSADKPAIMEAQQALLAARYDLSDAPSAVLMTRGKAVQTGVRVRLPEGTTWEQLAALPPDQIKAQDLFPRGFLPLPHPNHPLVLNGLCARRPPTLPAGGGAAAGPGSCPQRGTGVQSLAQPLTDHVAGHNRGEQHRAREQGEPPGVHVLPAIFEQRAP